MGSKCGWSYTEGEISKVCELPEVTDGLYCAFHEACAKLKEYHAGAAPYGVGPAPEVLVRRNCIPVPALKDTNPKDAIAGTKAPLSLCSPVAMIHWAIAQAVGLTKYGAWNWRISGVRSSVYLHAIVRHFLRYLSGEEFDPIDGQHHLGAIMACCAIMLDAKEAGKLTDDRPPSVNIGPLLEWAETIMKKLQEQYADKTPRHYTIADTEK